MMKVRNVSLLVGAAVLLFSVSIVPAVQMQSQKAGGNNNVPHFPSGGTVLYSQLDAASGNGAPDQEFEAVYAAYSSEGADDFQVSGGPWNVGGLNTPGIGGGSIHVNVVFYADAGGTPAAAPVAGCDYQGVTDYTDAAGDLSINLNPPCVLNNGTFWVAQEVRQDFTTAGQHFWGDRNVQSGSEGVWRNPGNGFGLGCTDWTPKTVCGVGSATAPDFLFELTGPDGQDTTTTTTGTPAVGPFGMLMTVLALGGGSAYVMARRRR
jgi:hypothetical protein